MKNIKEKEKNISEIVKNISEIMRVLPKLVMKCAVLRCRSVLPWRLSRMPLEKAHEMLRIVKAERLAHLSDAQRKVVEQLLGMGEQAAGN